jgi:hypothetical protein
MVNIPPGVRLRMLIVVRSFRFRLLAVTVLAAGVRL